MRRLGKIFGLIVGVVVLGVIGSETVTVSAEGYTDHEIIMSHAKEYTYKGITYLYLNNEGGGVEIVGYNGNGDYLELPRKIDGKEVVHIGGPGFEHSTVRKITIPDGVARISLGTFYGCEELEEVNLPRSIRMIETETFYGCINLKKINFPEGLERIQSDAFYDCDKLEKIKLPDSLKSIGTGGFKECDRLKEVELPDGLESIGGEAFYGCENLEKIELTDNLREIGAHAFEGCRHLYNVTFPKNLASVGECAFKGCENLNKIEFLRDYVYLDKAAFSECVSLCEIESVGNILCGENVFNNCSRLPKEEIPRNITHIESGAFEGCSGLENLRIPDGIVCIEEEAFSNCKDMVQIIFPETLVNIEAGAFRDCEKLEAVSWGEKIEYIGDSAFEGCDTLKVCNLPKSLVEIGKSAFMHCVGETFYLSENMKYIGDGAFGRCPVEISNDVWEHFEGEFGVNSHIHVVKNSEADKWVSEEMKFGTIGRWIIISCTEEGGMWLDCEKCEEQIREGEAVHEYEDGYMTKEEACYVMVRDGKTLKCLACGFEVGHNFDEGKVIGGSKIVAPIIREEKCIICGFVRRWSDWSNAWLTGIVAVVLLGFLIAIINYMRRMKKN